MMNNLMLALVNFCLGCVIGAVITWGITVNYYENRINEFLGFKK